MNSAVESVWDLATTASRINAPAQSTKDSGRERGIAAKITRPWIGGLVIFTIMLQERALATFATLVCLSALGYSQCQPRVSVPGDMGYRKRGEKPSEKRCEGMIEKPVAALEGTVFSLTRGVPVFDAQEKEVIYVTAPSIRSKSMLACTGTALTATADYCLDLELEPKGTRSVPARDVIARKSIHARAFGMVAVDQQRADLYVPVTVSARSRNGQVVNPDSVYVVFSPTMMLKDHKVQVRSTMESGDDLVWEMSGVGQYDEHRPLRVSIPLDRLGLPKGGERELMVRLTSEVDTRGKGKELVRNIRVLFAN